MAKLNDDQMRAAIQAHLEDGETLKHWAFGQRQPHILVIAGLMLLLALLPGLIVALLMTKSYLIGLTDRRLLVLQIKSTSNAEVKSVTAYDLRQLEKMSVSTWPGPLMTRIRIVDEARPFDGKFHRAFSKGNREQAAAIASAIGSKAA